MSNTVKNTSVVDKRLQFRTQVVWQTFAVSVSTFPVQIDFQVSRIYFISSNVLFPVVDQERILKTKWKRNRACSIGIYLLFFVFTFSLKKDTNSKTICGLQCCHYFISLKTWSNFHHDAKLRGIKYAFFWNIQPISSPCFPNTITFFKDNIGKFHRANNSCELRGLFREWMHHLISYNSSKPGWSDLKSSIEKDTS